MPISPFRFILCGLTAGFFLALWLGQIPQAWADLPPLIPREVFFDNPEKFAPQLAPNGRRLAWIAPDKKNILQVWIKTVGKDDDQVVTADKKRGIRRYFWAQNSKILIYLQDADGDENWHVYGVDLDSGNVRDYTPFQGVRADIIAINPKFLDQILVQINLRDRRLFDVYRLNLRTGALIFDTKNPGDVSVWRADDKLQIRAALIQAADGGTEIRIRKDVKSSWKRWIKVGPDEILNFLDFTTDGKAATLISSIGSDTARVVERNIATNFERVIAASADVDPANVIIHPQTHVVQAVSFEPGRARWTVIDPSLQTDFDSIAKLNAGDFNLINRDHKDRTWLVVFTSDRAPIQYYAWDRTAKKATFLFAHQSKLDGLRLAEMKPVIIKSRDELSLNSYLTLPVGVPPENLPMVLLVHGGPWGRDVWGYNPLVQWLANRGYAVLQVNFRASTGYGKKFLYAGNKQWGLRMHDDLIDAVDWAVQQGFADPKRIAIMGISYGGYAALAGVTFTPEKFSCAIDVVGPSNLKTLIGSIPPYWKAIRSIFDVRMGNVDDPKDAELIKNASPLFKADKIVRPLLIGHGANDPRVNQRESEQIVEAIEKNKGKVTYVLYSDEGHGFARPENRLDFNARAEAFLSTCLGGRAEPLAGDIYPGSTAVVRVVGQ